MRKGNRAGFLSSNSSPLQPCALVNRAWLAIQYRYAPPVRGAGAECFALFIGSPCGFAWAPFPLAGGLCSPSAYPRNFCCSAFALTGQKFVRMRAARSHPHGARILMQAYRMQTATHDFPQNSQNFPKIPIISHKGGKARLPFLNQNALYQTAGGNLHTTETSHPAIEKGRFFCFCS